jgi:hypothetical protein
MSEGKEKKAEEGKEVTKEAAAAKKAKEVKKDAEVLKLLEEDEDDFEEFEEGGKCDCTQPTSRTPPRGSTPSSGGRTGTTRISMTSSRRTSRRNSELRDRHISVPCTTITHTAAY